MTDPSATVEQPHEIHTPVDHGMSITKAAVISIVSAILVMISMYEVVKGTLSSGMTRVLAVVSLLSLVALVYGLNIRRAKRLSEKLFAEAAAANFTNFETEEERERVTPLVLAAVSDSRDFDIDAYHLKSQLARENEDGD